MKILVYFILSIFVGTIYSLEIEDGFTEQECLNLLKSSVDSEKARQDQAKKSRVFFLKYQAASQLAAEQRDPVLAEDYAASASSYLDAYVIHGTQAEQHQANTLKALKEYETSCKPLENLLKLSDAMLLEKSYNKEAGLCVVSKNKAKSQKCTYIFRVNGKRFPSITNGCHSTVAGITSMLRETLVSGGCF